MNKRILNLLVLTILIGFGACKEDEPGQEDILTNMLTANAWANAIVTHEVDGDLSFQYEDFAIQFTKQPSDGYATICGRSCYESEGKQTGEATFVAK